MPILLLLLQGLVQSRRARVDSWLHHRRIVLGRVDLAGFTDVPVTGMNTIWINTSDSQIASPANHTGEPGEVAPSTTRTNIIVAMNSDMNA